MLYLQLLFVLLSPDSLSLDTVVVNLPEAVVQTQLDAYNARDINTFMDTCADSIRIYEYPNVLLMEGKKDVRERYAEVFDKVTNLHTEIKHRIVLGDKVIDHERVQFGESQTEAVAIYEVSGGKIVRVTFIRGANSD